MVLQVARLRSGRRCVTSITDVVGMEKDVVITEELWHFDGEGFAGSGRQPSWMEAVDRAGLRGELVEVLQMANNDAEAREMNPLILAAAAGGVLLVAAWVAVRLAAQPRDADLTRRLERVAAAFGGGAVAAGARRCPGEHLPPPALQVLAA